MNAQQAFNSAVEAVIAQGRPGMEGPTCVYRSVQFDGSSVCCAVGLLLTDAELNTIESEDYLKSAVRRLAEVDLLPTRLSAHTTLLVSLQGAHDRAADMRPDFVAAFKENARRVASTHGLELPAVLR